MADYIELTRFLDRSQAELAQSKLTSEGIHSVIQADDVAGMRPFLTYGHGVRLSVHQSDLGKARDSLQLSGEFSISGRKELSLGYDFLKALIALAIGVGMVYLIWIFSK